MSISVRESYDISFFCKFKSCSSLCSDYKITSIFERIIIRPIQVGYRTPWKYEHQERREHSSKNPENNVDSIETFCILFQIRHVGVEIQLGIDGFVENVNKPYQTIVSEMRTFSNESIEAVEQIPQVISIKCRAVALPIPYFIHSNDEFGIIDSKTIHFCFRGVYIFAQQIPGQASNPNGPNNYPIK